MSFSRAQIKRQMGKVNKIAVKNRVEGEKLYKMCENYYGEENYSDHDKDEIIDPLDYGQGEIEFERFDEIMKEINRK